MTFQPKVPASKSSSLPELVAERKLVIKKFPFLEIYFWLKLLFICPSWFYCSFIHFLPRIIDEMSKKRLDIMSRVQVYIIYMYQLQLSTIAAASSIGLFTVAILGPFSAHFQTHFGLIFVCLAEKQTKGNEKWDEKWCEKWLPWNPRNGNYRKMKQKCIFLFRHTAK